MRSLDTHNACLLLCDARKTNTITPRACCEWDSRERARASERLLVRLFVSFRFACKCMPSNIFAEVRCPSLTSSNFIAIQNHTNSQTKCAGAHMRTTHNIYMHIAHALDMIKIYIETSALSFDLVYAFLFFRQLTNSQIANDKEKEWEHRWYDNQTLR